MLCHRLHKYVVTPHSSVLDFIRAYVSEDKYSWNSSTTENVIMQCQYKHELNYQCQRKNDRDQGHFGNYTQEVYKDV